MAVVHSCTTITFRTLKYDTQRHYHYILLLDLRMASAHSDTSACFLFCFFTSLGCSAPSLPLSLPLSFSPSLSLSLLLYFKHAPQPNCDKCALSVLACLAAIEKRWIQGSLQPFPYLSFSLFISISNFFFLFIFLLAERVSPSLALLNTPFVECFRGSFLPEFLWFLSHRSD